MGRAMGVLCDEDGRALTKLHGLRMLRRTIVEAFPLASADACTIALCIGRDKLWTGSYQPLSKAIRARLMAENYATQHFPATWKPRPLQDLLPMLHAEA